MFTDLKTGDFASATLMFQRGREYVPGSVGIAIVRSPAVRTKPLPYSKPCDTSRPRRWQTATRRTGLGTPAFVNIDIDRLPSGRFVPQHMSEARPASIKNGLRHSRFGKLGRAYVADRYQSVLPNDPRGLLVKVMASGIGDLRRNSPDAGFVSSALRNSELCLVLPVVLQSGDNIAAAGDGQLFQPKVNADLSVARSEIVLNLALERHIPATASILHKGAGLEYAFNVPALPEAIARLEVDGGIAVNTDRARDKGHPAQGALCPEAGTKSGTAAVLVAGFGKLSADRLDRIGVQTKVGRTSGCQLDQVKCGRPAAVQTALAPAFAFALGRNTEVPHLITSGGEAIEPPVAGLDTVFERQHRHAGCLISLRGAFKRKGPNIGGSVTQ